MEEFNISLVREKVVFIDEAIGEGADSTKASTVIRSNRVFLKLGKSPSVEKVVVRTQSMHTALRLVGKILYSYYREGAFLTRDQPFDWAAQWESVLSSYETEFNPQVWAVVYVNGEVVFKTTTSSFVDVIEKCAELTVDNYDSIIGVTEKALKQVGHAMRIDHSSNVAATLTDTGSSIRCGIIHRSSRKDTIFSFMGMKGDQNNRIVQFVNIAAAYLEIFNLQFILHTLQQKILMGKVPEKSPEGDQIRAATLRQNDLNNIISVHEKIYDIKYRPAKPDLFSNT